MKGEVIVSNCIFKLNEYKPLVDRRLLPLLLIHASLTSERSKITTNNIKILVNFILNFFSVNK